jgi:isopropylmalate/homocitrate/citramalate synthase
MGMPWRSDKWFTSPWNWLDDVRAGLEFPARVQLHDVTLRDGEQQAGIIFTKDEKIRIAEALAEVGVHRIEAGMPVVSADDADAVREIVRRNLGPDIYAFARCMKDDVQRAVDCGVKGIVVEIPSSTHMIEKAYGWQLERAISLSVEATAFAHEQGLRVVFFPIDLSRAEFDWGMGLIERVAREGWMDALAVVDTFGGLAPHAIPWLIRTMKERVGKPLEAHFHDDFGMGAANSLLAVAAGAEVVHTTIAALGERAGNTPYEDLALALLTMYGVDMGLRYEKMVAVAKMVEGITGQQNRWNRAIFGEHLTDIESGIIAGWYRNCKDEPTMLAPYDPALVGGRPIDVVLGKNSGIESVRVYAERLGVDLTDELAQELVREVKARAYEKHALLTLEDFRDIIRRKVPASTRTSR